MADEGRAERGPLSEWLELMLAEITRRQEEAQAGDIERAARASEPSQRPTADTPSASRLPAAPRAKPASSHARTVHRARGA